jgi:hypothetical protein
MIDDVKRISWVLGGFAAGVVAVISCGAGPGGSSAGDPGTAGNGGAAGNSAGGACTTCTVTGPIQALTADTDLAQLSGGPLKCEELQPKGTKLVDGPFVVTDVVADESGALRLYTVPQGSSCDDYGSLFVEVGQTYGNSILTLGNRPTVSGARLFLAKGETLCASLGCSGGSQELRWSGFRPYGG